MLLHFALSPSSARMAEVGRFGKGFNNFRILIIRSCHTLPEAEENKQCTTDINAVLNRADRTSGACKCAPGNRDAECQPARLVGVALKSAGEYRYCIESLERNNTAERNSYLFEKDDYTDSSSTNIARMWPRKTTATFILEEDAKLINILTDGAHHELHDYMSGPGMKISRSEPSERWMSVEQTATHRTLETQPGERGSTHLPFRVYSRSPFTTFGEQVSYCSKKCLVAAVLTKKCKSVQQPQRPFCTVLRINAGQSNSNTYVLLLRFAVVSSCRPFTWKGNNDSSLPPLYRSKTAYYDILEVSPSATQAQIKTAYYKQSFIYHPDKNAGSKEANRRFSEISEAYSVLGSLALRKKYDHGILTQSDLQGAGKPSAKEVSNSSAKTPPHKMSRNSSSTAAGTKPIFDFDAFYQAHYGEQLHREKVIRWRREQLRQRKRENFKKWRQGKLIELTVALMLAVGSSILIGMHTGN